MYKFALYAIRAAAQFRKYCARIYYSPAPLPPKTPILKICICIHRVYQLPPRRETVQKVRLRTYFKIVFLWRSPTISQQKKLLRNAFSAPHRLGSPLVLMLICENKNKHKNAPKARACVRPQSGTATKLLFIRPFICTHLYAIKHV